jgi:hypothetical protein
MAELDDTIRRPIDAASAPSRALVCIDHSPIVPSLYPLVVADAHSVKQLTQVLVRIDDRLATMELRMDRMLMRMDATLTHMDETLTRIERSLVRLQAMLLLTWFTTMLVLLGSILRWWR